MRLVRNAKAFTLIELLVVITILAIISVVAYTSFGGATDKAKNSAKLGHLSTIEAALGVFNQKNNYYPLPSLQSAKNLWGFDATKTATAQNSITPTIPPGSEEISAVTADGGGYVYQTTGTAPANILGAKGVIDSSRLSKEYLSSELSDPALKDIKVGTNETFHDYGIGKYVYAVYSKPDATAWNNGGKKGAAYNLAATIVDEQKGEITKISGNFDQNFTGCAGACPVSLIGPGGSTTAVNLVDSDLGAGKTPYKIAF